MPPGELLPEGWKGAFLVAYGMGQSIEKAADTAGVGASTVYAHRVRDLAFQAEWNAAKETRRLLRVDKAWDANDALVDDPKHQAHHAAVKLAIDKNDRDTQDEPEGATDHIAEAIDRFTNAVVGLARQAQPTGDLPQPPGGAPAIAPPDAH